MTWAFVSRIVHMFDTSLLRIQEIGQNRYVELVDRGDPLEGLEPDGTIRTGASADRIPARFAPIVSAAASRITAAESNASIYLYGSVATGRAICPYSDVDLLTIGLESDTAAGIATDLSARFAEVCRGVEIAAPMPADFDGDGDDADGGRVFLHHYCAHLAGPDLDRATARFPGDRRAARGFNGDIDRHVRRWRNELDNADPADLGRRIARKSLLAVAGLVSVHDGTWTTDRQRAGRRWRDVHPELAGGLDDLLASVVGRDRFDRAAIVDRLDGVVDSIVEQFGDDIGLWDASIR